MLSMLSCSTSKKAIPHNAANNINASRGFTRPAAMGREQVRATSGSISLSAKSLITHPAERMTKTPTINISTIDAVGCPSPASHNDHKLGHSSRKLPMGRSARISSRYCLIFSARLVIRGIIYFSVFSFQLSVLIVLNTGERKLSRYKSYIPIPHNVTRPATYQFRYQWWRFSFDFSGEFWYSFQ